MKLTLLPDRIVRLVSKRDRAALGLKTRDELCAAAEIKTERDLHKHIANLLRLRGIEFFASRMDKRTTRPKGEPDFLFSVSYKPQPDNTAAALMTWAIAVGWEIKMPGRQLDPEQQKMFSRMAAAPNGWQCRVISSVDEALTALGEMGL